MATLPTGTVGGTGVALAPGSLQRVTDHVRKKLGRKVHASKVDGFVHALVAVTAGLKPSLLFEASVLEAKELLDVVDACVGLLYPEDSTSEHHALACLVLESDKELNGEDDSSAFWGPGTLMVAHAGRLCKHLEERHQPVLVNVSRTQGAPTVVAAAADCALHRQAAAIRTRVAEGLQGQGRVITGAAGGDHCASLSAAVGILLGYPVVYCVPTAEQDNCLGNTELQLTEVYATCSGAQPTAGGAAPAAAAHVLLSSFSVPAALLEHEADGARCRSAVEAWKVDMQALWARQCIYNAVAVIRTSTVCLAQVAL